MTRRVVAIVIAVAVAALGAFGAIVYASAADSRALAGQQTVAVYIANAEIPSGTTAEAAAAASLMTAQTVVSKGVPAGALTVLDDTTKALVATSAIHPGEVVLASRFGTSVQTGPVSTGVPAGKVAVTITLADPQRTAPLLAPGASIVIYDTFSPRDPKAAKPVPNGAHLGDEAAGDRVTRVVLSKVTVIGVGSDIASSTDATAAQGGTTAVSDRSTGTDASDLVTVAVSPQEALTLIHAAQTGTLYAALLGSGTKVNRNDVVRDTTVLSR